MPKSFLGKLLMFITLTEEKRGQRSIIGHPKEKKEMIMYMEGRIQQKNLEIRNNRESTLTSISIFNKFTADLLIGLLCFDIHTHTHKYINVYLMHFCMYI